VLRNQSGLALRDVLYTAVGKMRDLVRRFRARQLVPRGRDLGAALFHDGRSFRDLVGHLGDFELAEKLAFADVISEIDPDRPHIAGDFGHHIYFLKGLEFRCHRD
jgi:hypothetical protein